MPFTFAYLRLRELDRFAEALLNALLPDEVNLTEQTNAQRRPLFERLGVLLAFGALSDGYQAFIG